MFGRKILFLAAGYVAGNVVNSVYNSQKKKAIKSQKKEDIKMMVDNFVDTQKNFISDMEEKYIPLEHKNTFTKKKEEFLALAKKYTTKGKELFEELSQDERVQKGTETAKNATTRAKTEGKNAIKKGKLIAGKMKDQAEKLKK